jgi:hypothetical protein
MSTDLFLYDEVAARRTSDDDDLEHYYCECDSNWALCGADVSDAADHTLLDTPLEDDCVVCVDLLDSRCPRCGAA